MELEKKASLTAVLDSELTCPICYTVCRPPIVQCRNGHRVCHSCRPLVNKCGICRAPMTNIRNLFAETVSDYLYSACPYQPNGCRELLSRELMTEHEIKCPYTILCHCVLNGDQHPEKNPYGFITMCGWHGTVAEQLLNHAVACHPLWVLAPDQDICVVNLSGVSCQTFLMVAYQEIFWVFFTKCKTSIHGTVEGVGWHPYKKPEYYYWFELSSAAEDDKKQKIVKPRSPVKLCYRKYGVLNFFARGRYTQLIEGEDMGKFVSNGEIHVRVLIERNDKDKNATKPKTSVQIQTDQN